MKKLNIENNNNLTIRLSILVFILLCCVFNGMAEEKNETKQKMLEIKLNDYFIFGEANNENKDIAYGEALEDLVAFANEIKDENYDGEISMKDILANVESLVYEEDERYEIIVYMPLKIVLEKSNAKRAPKSTSTEETVIVLNEPLPKINNNKKPEEKYVSVGKGEIEDFLITQENFSEIKNFLTEMKRQGKIRETGASESDTGLPLDANLIVMDELGGILTLLTPARENQRINYKTQEIDSVNNYNSKFIVWYRK